MTAVVKGRAVRVEVAASYAAPIVVTSVTLAPSGVASATGHGLVAGRAGYFSGVAGMRQLEGQAVSIYEPAANTFSLGVDTSRYGPFVSGSFVPVASWETLGEATSYSIGTGSSERYDATRIDDVMVRERLALLGAQSISIGAIAMTTHGAAMSIIETAALSGGTVLLRITHADGSVRIALAEPGLPPEDVQLGMIGASPLQFLVCGFVVRRPGVPPVIVPPAQVTGLSAGATTQTTQALSWTGAAGATAYTVQYKTSASSTWLTFGSTAFTTATVTGLTAGTAYDYRVYGVGLGGNGPVSATLTVSTTAAPVSPPGQVVGLAAGTATSSTQPLSWTATATAAAYLVEYKASSSGTWLSFGSVGTNAATVTGLTAATSYDYRITASNSGGSGAVSATVTASTAAAAATQDYAASDYFSADYVAS